MYDLFEALNRAHQLDEKPDSEEKRLTWKEWNPELFGPGPVIPELAEANEKLKSALHFIDFEDKQEHKRYEGTAIVDGNNVNIRVKESLSTLGRVRGGYIERPWGSFCKYTVRVDENTMADIIVSATKVEYTVRLSPDRAVKSNSNEVAKMTADKLDEAAFSGGYAEGGSLDTAKRPGGSTKGSGTNFKALDGKKTKTVKAKDLKPGMITDTGKILKVTNIGWVNGKPSVEVSYGGIGNRGSYASDTVAADRDYEVLDEMLTEDSKEKKLERPKGYKGTAGGYLSIDRYGTFVSRKPDSGGVQISSANYDWIKDNFDLVEQPDLEYKTMWGRGVVYKIVDKKK